MFARAFVGGMSGIIGCGDLGPAFVSAGLTAWLVPGPANGFNGAEFMRNLVVGGTISWATGGKFGNGAFSAAYSYAVAAGAQTGGVGEKETGNHADANGKVEDPNGQEGVETFRVAQQELIRQKKLFANKAQYVDGYMVAYFDENGNLVEPREFSADDWDGALAHAKKTGKFIVNGLYNSKTESITIYRSATHQSIKSFKSPLKIYVRGEYSNLETAINVIAHEINHYAYPNAEHSYAYEAGHQAVINYRKFKNGH